MTMGHVAGLSAELLPRATMFAQYSNQASSMSAMQQLQMMKMNGMVPWTGNQMTQMQYEMSAFARFKEQSMKALKQQEIDVLNEVEKDTDTTPTDEQEQAKEPKKKYVVVHDFKDLKDNNIIYIKGDIYPRRADSIIDEERVKELSSTKNKMNRVLIKEQD